MSSISILNQDRGPKDPLIVKDSRKSRKSRFFSTFLTFLDVSRGPSSWNSSIIEIKTAPWVDLDSSRLDFCWGYGPINWSRPCLPFAPSLSGCTGSGTVCQWPYRWLYWLEGPPEHWLSDGAQLVRSESAQIKAIKGSGCGTKWFGMSWIGILVSAKFFAT